MVVTDLANVAAAQSAGYRLIQVDRAPSFTGAVNAGLPPRYLSRFEKQMIGSGGASGEFIVVEGESNASFAASDAAALAALNAWRRHEADPTQGDGPLTSGDPRGRLRRSPRRRAP